MDCRRIRIELGGLLHSRAVARVSTLNVGNGSRAEGRRTQRRDEKTAACRTATEAKVPCWRRQETAELSKHDFGSNERPSFAVCKVEPGRPQHPATVSRNALS